MAGMDHGAMKSMDHSKMDRSTMDSGKTMKTDHSKMGAGKKSKMESSKAKPTDHSKMKMASKSKSMKMDHANMKGMDHSKMPGMKMTKSDPFYAVGSGLSPKAPDSGRFLSYTDLKAQRPLYKHRKATREIELRLTGNMERYIWSINGKKYQDDEEIRLKYGERVRFKFVNETMMSHPMHLHGMWTILDNGSGKYNPLKHTVSIAPGTTVYTETEVDAVGQWAFHCHLSYHARAGMFRRIVVEGGPKTAAVTPSQSLTQ
jgi:FtsP/CotA-like multicopper oxidase with cupredoxin domain